MILDLKKNENKTTFGDSLSSEPERGIALKWHVFHICVCMCVLGCGKARAGDRRTAQARFHAVSHVRGSRDSVCLQAPAALTSPFHGALGTLIGVHKRP